MKFKYYNANPLGRKVNDCTVRAISMATNTSWDKTYEELSKFAQAQAIMLDEVQYIDGYLRRKFYEVYTRKDKKITVEEFIEKNPTGTFLITMNGHITCCIDGCIYDTFNPRKRYVWAAYLVK